MPEYPPELLHRARSLARDTLIIDGHIDYPYWMKEVYAEDVSARTIGGDFDYERAKEGGLDAAFMSIFVPARYQESGGASDYANELIDLVESLVDRHPDRFAVATTPGDIRDHHLRGLVSLPLGIENGAAIEEDLRNLEYFHGRGVRYMTLVHAKDNLICDSSFDTERTWGGLSEYGAEVVLEMERIGIMVDISHVTDDAFRDVLEIVSRPVIATHSSARRFTPGWERNMSDELIRALAAAGGVMMINFGSDFLDASHDAITTRLRKRMNARLEKAGLDRSSDEGFRIFTDFRRSNPVGDVTDVVRHIRYVRDLVGIEHVGLGSDFDGVFGLPRGLQDVSGYPNLVAALMDAGFTDDEIRLVCGENLMRVWQEIDSKSSRA